MNTNRTLDPFDRLAIEEERSMYWRTIANKLEADNAALQEELNAQAVVNGKGGEREAKLLAENAALQADKERLDWLIKNQIGVAYGAVSFEAFDKITRAAIDAARKEAQP